MNDLISQPAMGRLQAVLLRDYWTDEARHFTPWLARPENIVLLSEAISLDLEVQGEEQWVGPFRADILCKDTRTGRHVLVENQLERTDHGHLGQILTYAAGLDAFTAVWISSRFTDEHRAALDWLNNMTLEGINFFGLEIELWKIGDSAVAPKFNVVCQPNDWTKSVKSTPPTNPSEGQQLYLAFWAQFKDFMAERRSLVRIGKPSTDSWTSVAVGRTNFTVYLTISVRNASSSIYLAMTSTNAKAQFAALKAEFGAEIDAQLGAVEWRELPEAKESQIVLRRSIPITDRASWPELNDWFASNVERWVAVLRPLVRQLPDAGD